MKKTAACVITFFMLLTLLLNTGVYASATETPGQKPPTVEKVTTTDVSDGKFRIIVTVKDNGSGLAEVTVKDSGKKNVASKAQDEAEANGTYSFKVDSNAEYYVFAYDMDGETGNPKGVFVDKKAPVISKPVYDSESYTNKPVDVDFTVTDTSKIKSVTVKSDSGSSVTVKNDGSGSYSFSVEKNGTYSIIAEDNQGNKSSATKVTVDKIDTQAPTVTADIQQSDEISKEPRTFSYTVKDNVGIGSVLINGKTIIELERPRTSYSNQYTASEGGEITIEVRDLAGNSTVKMVNVGVIDLHPPVIEKALSIDEIADVEAKASITVMDDSELSYEWYITGGANSDWGKLPENASSVAITGLKRETSYTVKVIVTDEAGNSVTDSRTFTTLNETAVTEDENYTGLFILIGVIILFIIGSVSLILFLLFRKKKNADGDGDDDDDNDGEYDEYDDDEDYQEYDEYGYPITRDYDQNQYNQQSRREDIGEDLYRQAAWDQERRDRGTHQQNYSSDPYGNRQENNHGQNRRPPQDGGRYR